MYSNCWNVFRRCIPQPTTTIPAANTVQMCFVQKFKDGRNSQMDDHVLLNIQVIECKPDETCDPAMESQYYGWGLGYVFFYIICNIQIKE